ncbi:ABC transporter substrate-binding protein [Thermodesulfobacteriota bacterium]
MTARWRVITLLVLAAILVAGGIPYAQAPDSIKIGFMAPYVGVYTKLGQDMDKGFKLYLDEVGWKAGGRKIEMIKSDTEGKPSLGPTKVRELVEKDKVDLLSGIVHSGVAYSIRDYVDEKKIPLILTNAGAPKLTAEKKSPYIFRISFANGQHDLAGGWYAYNKLGLRKMAVLAPDYSAGHDKAKGFMKYFKAAGGKIVKEIYPPMGTQDFAPYLAEIRKIAKEIDGTWAFFSGSMCIRFITQYDEYGLGKQAPLFVIGDTVDDAFLPSMRNAALGVKNYTHYALTLDNPENKKFVEAYLKKYKEDPSMFSEQGYVGAKVIVDALSAINGKVEDKDAFLAAVKQAKFNAPRGPFKFDKNQNVVENIYIRRVEKVGGKLRNVVTDVIKDVDQNWKPPK